MRLRRWKKFAPHLIIMATLIATVVPTLGAHILNELTPYLNLTSVTSKPEAVELESMEIVDKKYEKHTVEYLKPKNSWKITVKYPIWEIEGIYLQSQYRKKDATNYYNSRLVLINDETIDLTLAPLPPGASEIPVVVEYTIREWTEITWALDLKVNNRGDDTIIFPRANLTLNFLEGNLAKGWISREYEIKGHESKIVKAYLVMKNDRFFDTFLSALLLGEPLDLTLGLEAYILAEGRNDEPLVPIIYSVDMDFSMPELSRGPPPFIHSITRAPVSANQPVTISVSGSDEGTGISNRTYIYYSIDGGASWDSTLLIGGEWWNKYAGVPFYGYINSFKRNRFPILSTLQEEIYEGVIPSFPAGTQVLFKVYLEDYADNIDHMNKGNWVWSQTYSYIVPGSGELPEFTVEFKKSTEESLSKRLMKYLELNGFILDHFLFTRGLNTNIFVTTLFPEIAGFFYENNVDSSYALQMLILHNSKATDILADSGIASGYLLDLFGISFKDLFNYIVDNIFLPTKQETTLTELAKDKFAGINVIEDIEGTTPRDHWYSSPSGTVEKDMGNYLIIRNFDPIGDRSIKWIVDTQANLSCNLPMPKDLSKNDILSFYIDYNDYLRLNGNLSVVLIDNIGRKMTSKQIYFEETVQGTFQEIALGLNSNNFEIESGFNYREIHQINFTYSGTDALILNIDYICAYSTSSYDLHQYLVYDLRMLNIYSLDISIEAFITNLYSGTARTYWANGEMPSDIAGPIITDWEVDKQRMSSWNFINIVATNGTMEYDYGSDPNHHICAAATFLQYSGFPNGHKKLCELLGVEIDEFDEEPFTKEDIYPYTQSLATIMVYIPLGAVTALAIVLRVREHRYKTKVKKIRNKYKKIVNR